MTAIKWLTTAWRRTRLDGAPLKRRLALLGGKYENRFFSYVHGSPIARMCFHSKLGARTLGVAEAAGLRTWQLLDYDNFKNNGGFARYYVPPGENEMKSWSELITVGFLSGNKISIKEYLEANENRMKVRCPGTRHQVIESDTHNVYYTDTYPQCGGRESQSEISRFIQGSDGIHRLSYTVKGRELTTGEREKWLTILRSSFIAKGEKHEKVR